MNRYDLMNRLTNYGTSLEYRGISNDDHLFQRTTGNEQLMNIILIGALSLKNHQQEALLNFHTRFSKRHGDLEVVQLISDVVIHILIPQKMKKVDISIVNWLERNPCDFKLVGLYFSSFVPSLDQFKSLPRQIAAEIAPQNLFISQERVVSSLLEQVQNDTKNHLSYRELVHYTRLFNLYLEQKESYSKNEHDLMSAIFILLKNRDRSFDNQNVADFINEATHLIKKTEPNYPDEVARISFYLGEIVSDSIMRRQKKIETNNVTLKPLINIVEYRCSALLKNGEYLLTKSPIRIIVVDKDTSTHFPFMLTAKVNGKLHHVHCTLIKTINQELFWTPDEMYSNEVDSKHKYKTIELLIENFTCSSSLPTYKELKPLSRCHTSGPIDFFGYHLINQELNEFC